MTVRIGITGCLGRMGKAITLAALSSDQISLVGGTEINTAAGMMLKNPETGADLQAPILSDINDLMDIADVVADFTSPVALESLLEAAVQNSTALVIGTTGLTPDHHRLIDQASHSIPILQAGNTSFGVTVLSALVEKAASILDDSWDIEILEMHHRHKVDAPSGTATLLGDAAAAGRGVDLDDVAQRSRDGIIGARTPGDIGFATLRGGGVVGDHSVIMASEHERLVFSHKAEDRQLFASGATRAALWLSDQPAGRYDMRNALGLDKL